MALLALAAIAAASCAAGKSATHHQLPMDDDSSPMADDDDNDDVSPGDDDVSPLDDDDDDISPIVIDDDSSPSDDDDTAPLCPPSITPPSATVTIDPASGGRRFDGFGAISSAGNSRYLIDYPEPQRSQILDYLFKPGYGAALHILKVEIGGDMNSTSGADASHMHTADDLDCNRSYQWWMIGEAKKRNPNILIYGLAWGAPSWVRDPNYWSKETLDYLLAWIECGGTHHFMLDYLGGRNESMRWSPQWFIALKAALQARGWPTKIVAADTNSNDGWDFPEALANDPALAAVIDVVGVHYPCVGDGPHCSFSQTAIDLGKPLWASEASGGVGDWARIMNRQYLDARITGQINWPMIASAAAGAALSGNGVIDARQPWSGAYTVSPELWVWAHLTQFAQPGWRYLDGACGYPQNADGSSYTTLLSPDGRDLSILVETTLTSDPETLAFALAPAAPHQRLHVWASNLGSSNNDDFLVHQCDVVPVDGQFSLTFQPNYQYTISTTRGQGKGDAAGPSPASFPLPYADDFDGDAPGREAPWLATQMGAFEVGPCGGGRSGQCVAQTAVGLPIVWSFPNMLGTPFTLVGDGSLTDYEITVDALLEDDGEVRLLGRYANQVFNWLSLNTGYEFSLASDGAWEIRRDETSVPPVALASGTTAAWPVGTWKTLSFMLQGPQITASVDGVQIATVTDDNYTAGEAGFGIGGGAGTAFIPAQFDNLKIAAP
jgi:O-glycosyl hydrolase